ncbi:alanine--glyoxylate aminotransferase 2, mitochondrial-like [Branchiostoma floridae]|uniref:Alanine--glyoxylate aminotransferase 2, mitochondrial n=1 Tax=Branchiostoma floridae TaxID=7739 RepID=A0A9J7LBG2_BRAFL|nr:alanine--glyoxylate aminotransferase 2, mitochondrial-like [Branchiostoma floridae]
MLPRLSLLARSALKGAGTYARGVRVVSTLPEMPPCDFQPSPYKGISYEDAMHRRKTKLTPALLTYYKKPVMVYQGHMQWLWDVHGQRYLDLFAGIVTVSVGHCHPKVKEAAKEQLDLLWHTTNVYMHPPIHEYAEKLTSYLPGDLKVCYFTNSGSEANDLALLMARLHTGSFDIISFRNAYHGCSPTPWFANDNVFLTSGPKLYVKRHFPLICLMRFCLILQTDRSCSCAAGECMAKDMYLEQLHEVLRYSTGKRVAGFWAEPVQGVGGAVQYPKGFLKEAYAMVRERGGICIADEVQTGFGRLGSHFWGFQTHDVMPDMVVMAKGIGNGYPLAAVVTTPEIAQSMTQALHLNTFGGNPVACAVGSAVLDVMEEDGTQQNSADVGTYFLLELAKLRDEFSIVGDVRGKGLMIGLELVKDKGTREPLPGPDVVSIWEDIKDMGVLIGKGGFYGNVFRIKPPMCLTKQDVDFGVAIIRRAIEKYCEQTQQTKAAAVN